MHAQRFSGETARTFPHAADRMNGTRHCSGPNSRIEHAELLLFKNSDFMEAFIEAESYSNFIVLVGPHGSGVTTLLKWKHEVVSRSRTARYVELASMNVDQIVATLDGMYADILIARKRSAATDACVDMLSDAPYLFIDKMPLLKRDERAAVGAAIARILSLGTQVFLGLLPDNEELLNMFDDPVVFDAHDLAISLECARKSSAFFGSFGSFAYAAKTHGLVSLAAALMVDRVPDGTGDEYEACLERIFLETLTDCREPMLNKCLCASVLLSTGSTKDLGRLGLRLGDGRACRSEACASWAGYREGSKTFRFAGGELLPAGALAEILRRHPALSREACLVLLERGDLSRAAVMMRAMHRRHMPIDRFVPYAFEFHNAGFDDIVHVLVGGRRIECDDVREQKEFIRLLDAHHDNVDVNAEVGGHETALRRLLQERRCMFGDPVRFDPRSVRDGAAGSSHAGRGGLEAELAVHMGAVADLMRCEPKRALKACGSTSADDADTMLDVMRATARRIAIRLAGDGVVDDYESEHRVLVRRLEAMGRSEDARRIDLVFDVMDQLAGTRLDGAVVAGLRRRLAPGDGSYMEELVELVEIAKNLEDGYATQAFVRAANLCAKEFGTVQASVRVVAHGLACIAGTCVGERVSRLEDERIVACSTELRIFDEVLWTLLQADGDAASKLQDGGLRSMVATLEPSAAVMFLVRAALSSKPAVSDLMDAIAPVAWRSAFPGCFHRAERMRSEDALSMAGDGDARRVRIEVMGGFRVFKDGERIPEKEWKRSTAQSVILFLALSRNHCARRSDIGSMIWPSADYYKMREGMYSALSAARKALGETAAESRCIVAAMGKIMLDDTAVRVDKDEFEEAAKLIVRRQRSDQWVARNTDRVIRLFRGGMAVPPNDPEGVFGAEKRRLDTLFVDAMIEASRATARLGSYKESARFAIEARGVAPEREDAATCLIEALTKDGRIAEARTAYDEYVAYVILDTDKPPSRAVRAMFDSLVKTGGQPGLELKSA